MTMACRPVVAFLSTDREHDLKVSGSHNPGSHRLWDPHWLGSALRLGEVWAWNCQGRACSRQEPEATPFGGLVTVIVRLTVLFGGWGFSSVSRYLVSVRVQSRNHAVGEQGKFSTKNG